MPSDTFNLNDVEDEPTDEQPETLMNAAAAEANRRAEYARQALMRRLRVEMAEANRRWPSK